MTHPISGSGPGHKEGSALVYLMEELTDARLRCSQLKGYIDQATRLIMGSTHKAHIHEIAGDLLYGIPDSLFRLDKALDATALAASRIDYEELKQGLRPEKVVELETALKDVRIRQFDRRAPQVAPQEMTMRKLATGSDVATALRHVASVIEDEERRGVSPSASKIAEALQAIAGAVTASAGDDARRSRFEEGKPADPTKNMSPEDAKEWKSQTEEHKDEFKAAATLAPPPPQGDAVVGEGLDKILISTRKAMAAYASGNTKKVFFSLLGVVDGLGMVGRAYDLEVGYLVRVFKTFATMSGGKPALSFSASEEIKEAASGDPRWIHAKYPGKDVDGAAFKKGDLVLYWPSTKTIMSGKKAEDAWRKFEVEVADEDVYNGGHYASDYDKAFKEAAQNIFTRFEEGKPADPTKNMSEDDAATWKAMTEEHKDNFKAASSSDAAIFMRLREGQQVKVDGPTLGTGRVLTVESAPKKSGEAWNVYVSSGNVRPSSKKGGVLRYSETPMYTKSGDEITLQPTLQQKPVEVTKLTVISAQEADRILQASGDEEHLSRFEEGKPADPTKNMDPEDAKEWKAQTEEHKDQFKSAASNAKVSTFFLILSSYLTQQDQKDAKRERSPNIYRLGIFLKAMQEAEDKLRKYADRDDDEAMEAMKAVLTKAFNPGFPPLNKILKQINEWQASQKLPKLNKI